MQQKMNPVSWFEIPVTDLNRAKKFYESIFNYTLESHEMGPVNMAWFPMEMGLAGSTGTLIEAEGYTPSSEGTLVYFTVDSIEETIDRITSQGGSIVKSKTDIGEHGYIAHFKDSEGNRVAIHTPKEN